MANENQMFLSLGLVQAIGDYLVGRPYREVAPLLNTLQTEIQANQAAAANVPAASNGSQQPINLQENETPQGELQ